MTTWLNDLKNNIVLADGSNSLQPASRTTTANGAGVDLSNADGPCFALITVGTVSAGTTAPTLDVKLQESTASTGTYTDITGATVAQITTLDHAVAINFRRTKRFVRAVGTMGGTTPSVVYGVTVFGQKKAT